ncbi:serine protease [Brevundimonas sp. 2R-24]|uniref:Serine protease n=1 Tax=Peiella sedimenti TaxID=3061083 RepID=A0ABT8SIJ6_9CAUL|nr:serine protease [Caulobacteraceae bacterium XZ-24]
MFQALVVSAALQTQAPAEASFVERMIAATVQLDQPNGDETRTVGTGFLIYAPRPDGTPRVVLVTAAHVLEQMSGDEVRIGWRGQLAGGAWRYEPESIPIRQAATGQNYFVRHPQRDVAVLEVTAPFAFERAAIPLAWMADERGLLPWGVRPGSEMATLGFPRGLSANQAGFPILRTGHVASWPLDPVEAFPTFLLDVPVFPGNSGGPVFASTPAGPLVVGVLTKTVELNSERLGIGVGIHAVYVREAISLLDAPQVSAPAPSDPAT